MTREEAISVINRCRMSNVPMPQAKFAFDMAIEALKADRPRGEWKRNTTYKSLVFCSECDMPYEAGMTPRNFCPNCGSDMRGETDED